MKYLVRWKAYLAIPQVKVVHGVGQQNLPQSLGVGVVLPRKEGVAAVDPPHVFVHPGPPFSPFAEPVRALRALLCKITDNLLSL